MLCGPEPRPSSFASRLLDAGGERSGAPYNGSSSDSSAASVAFCLHVEAVQRSLLASLQTERVLLLLGAAEGSSALCAASSVSLLLLQHGWATPSPSGGSSRGEERLVRLGRLQRQIFLVLRSNLSASSAAARVKAWAGGVFGRDVCLCASDENGVWGFQEARDRRVVFFSAESFLRFFLRGPELSRCCSVLVLEVSLLSPPEMEVLIPLAARLQRVAPSMRLILLLPLACAAPREALELVRFFCKGNRPVEAAAVASLEALLSRVQKGGASEKPSEKPAEQGPRGELSAQSRRVRKWHSRWDRRTASEDAAPRTASGAEPEELLSDSSDGSSVEVVEKGVSPEAGEGLKRKRVSHNLRRGACWREGPLGGFVEEESLISLSSSSCGESLDTDSQGGAAVVSLSSEDSESDVVEVLDEAASSRVSRREKAAAKAARKERKRLTKKLRAVRRELRELRRVTPEGLENFCQSLSSQASLGGEQSRPLAEDQETTTPPVALSRVFANNPSHAAVAPAESLRERDGEGNGEGFSEKMDLNESLKVPPDASSPILNFATPLKSVCVKYLKNPTPNFLRSAAQVGETSRAASASEAPPSVVFLFRPRLKAKGIFLCELQ